MQSLLRNAGPRPSRRWPILGLILGTLGLSAVALLGMWGWGALHPALPARAPLPGDRADLVMRRVEVTLADVEGFWRGRVPAVSGHGYRPLRLFFFTGETPSACSGGATVSGPFYCPETRTAAFDLAWLDALSLRLTRGSENGLSLVAARVAAEHVQLELGRLDGAALRLLAARRAERAEIREALALDADCLTGVWAAAAARRLGPLPPKFYGEMIWSARHVSEGLDRRARRTSAAFDPFAVASREARQAAFDAGLAAGNPDGCRTADGRSASG